MRHTIVLTCLLSVVFIGQPPVGAAQADPAARPVRVHALTPTQRQFARQFGQRIARNPKFQPIEADWRLFVRNQPKGMDLKGLLALVRQEAINAKNQELRIQRARADESSQRKTRLHHELTHVRQQKASANQRNKIADLEKRHRHAEDLARLEMVKLREAMQKQTQMMQILSSIMKNMNDTAKSIIQNMK